MNLNSLNKLKHDCKEQIKFLLIFNDKPCRGLFIFYSQLCSILDLLIVSLLKAHIKIENLFVPI